jgi:CheY-like chemotaxis protein
MHIVWIENESHWRDINFERIKIKARRLDIIPENELALPIEQIAKLIFEKYSTSDLFIINLNLIAGKFTRAQNAGVKLLKFIRLYNHHQHCIIYSFLSREQIMLMDPQNLIIFSQGITFHRLPCDLSKIPFNEYLNKTANENLSAFFKAESELPDDRHFVANWWGIYQLWKIHKVVENINEKASIDILEHSLSFSRKEMSSYQGLLAMYLKSEREPDIEEGLKKLQKIHNERYGEKQRSLALLNNVLNTKIKESLAIQKKIESLKESLMQSTETNPFSGLIKKIKRITNSTAIEENILYLEKVKMKTEYDLQILSDYLDLDSRKREEVVRIERQYESLRTEINQNINRIENLKMFLSTQFTLTMARDELKQNPPKILFIDDQAEDGWTFIFQQIIYSGQNNAFSYIVPNIDEATEDIVDKIMVQLNVLNPDLIILDLRLKGETGPITDISDISGIKVLESLQKLKISSPILITTASNKIWSYKGTFALGANAYWIKEGLDEKRNLEATIENYIRFVDLVRLLCKSEVFIFLKEFKELNNKFKDRTELFWWEAPWAEKLAMGPYPKTKYATKNEIEKILDSAIELFEDYLKIYVQNLQIVSLGDSIWSIIIAKLALVLEKIHQIDSRKTEYTLWAKMFDQLGQGFEKRWSNLRDLRNDSVHSQICKIDHLKTFVRDLFKYLEDYKDTTKSFGKMELHLNIIKKDYFKKKGQ